MFVWSTRFLISCTNFGNKMLPATIEKDMLHLHALTVYISTDLSIYRQLIVHDGFHQCMGLILYILSGSGSVH